MTFEAGVHPRLVMTAEDLPVLRDRARSGLKAKVLARAIQLSRNYAEPEHPAYLDFRERTSDLWKLRSGIFAVLPALNTLCTTYAFTGDTIYGDLARDALFAIIDNGLADVCSKAWGSDTEGWRRGPGHDKGKFAQTIALIYDICFDRFSKDQRLRFAEYARECIDIARESWRFDWGQVANNRGVRGVLAPTWLCLALEGDAEIEGADDYIRDGELAIDHYLLNSYDADGAPFEGPGYGGCLSHIALIAGAIKRHGGPDFTQCDRFERLPEYFLYELLPGGGYVNNLNDAGYDGGTVTCSLPLMGTKRGKLIPWLARQLDLHPVRASEWLAGSHTVQNGPTGMNLLSFLLWWHDDATVQSPQKLGYPVSHCFPIHGVAAMRTGWDPKDWHVSHFCGREQLKCHRQGDLNHMSFYALGERFLVDPGYGLPRTGTTRALDRWFGETEHHNCVLIDGMNQRGTHLTPGWAEGRMLEFQHTHAFDTTLGDASAATGPDHTVRRSLRRVVLVREEPIPYLAVLDLTERDGEPFLAEQIWHTSPENSMEIDGKRFKIEGLRNDCLASVLWPKDAELCLEDSYGRPRVRVSARGSVVETLTVFWPHRRGAEPPRFQCERQAEGRFTIKCRRGAKTTKLKLNALTVGPLRKAFAVTFHT